MIWTFLKIKHGFNDDRIKTVSSNLEIYKNDLWQLSWALSAYKPEKNSVNDEEIYEKIMVSITEIETKDKKTISAENVFLPLSIFYRFEIPIERKFFKEQMDIKEDILNQLIELSEIVETRKKGNRLLFLHHSSLADIYFRTYQNNPSFGKELKKIILNGRDEKYLEFSLFHRYITNNPENTLDIMYHIITFFHQRQMESTGILLIRQLSEDNEIQKKFLEGIKKEEDIKKIGVCISEIIMESPEVGLKIYKDIDIEVLSSKINTEKDIEKIGNFLLVTTLWSEETGIGLSEHIDIGALLAKINNEVDIIKIGYTLSMIVKTNIKVLTNIVNRLNPKLKEELKKGQNLRYWGFNIN